MDLHKETLRLMAETTIPVTEICRACEVTPRWYYMVRKGQIRSPRYHRLQRLHDYLNRNQSDAGSERAYEAEDSP